jgi:hypothetical protein
MHAQGTAWKTIHTTGDPNVTIEIPSGVDQEGPDIVHDKGDLMAFFASSSNRTDMACILHREEYSTEITQKSMATGLAGPNAAQLCGESGDNVSHFSAMGAQPTTSNGFPASACVSSYTDSSEKEPGTVYSRFTVAAPSAFYILSCTVSSENQEVSIWGWSETWQEAVAHIQASLRLPDAGK